MTALDLALLNAELAHAAKLMVEAVLVAGFLTFVWLCAPYFINGGPRR